MTMKPTTSDSAISSASPTTAGMRDVELGIKKEEKKKTPRLIPHTPDYEKKYGAYNIGSCYAPIDMQKDLGVPKL